MAYILDSGYPLPDYLTLVADDYRIEAAATETLDEYFVTNRYGFARDRVNSILDPILYKERLSSKRQSSLLSFKR